MTQRVVDLRSDTLTTPTPEMRRAMAEAEVGDDVFGEDPTVNRLQEMVASLCGMEAALYVPSGSMGNLVSLRAFAGPGDEIICHEHAHVLHYEVASLAAVAGVQARPLAGHWGVLDPDDIVAAIRPPMYTFPRTKAVAVENTHNLAGGTVYPIDDLRAARKVTAEHDLALYMDGARVFNASVASGVPVRDYCEQVDAISFCFSKGLGAPVGSMVAGSADFVAKAHRFRKMHGGGMRQAGILAAACIVALDSMVERLADDHANARRLAEGIRDVRENASSPENVHSNMVLVKTEPLGMNPADFVSSLGERGVRCLAYRPGTVRMVTHKDVSSDDIEFALEQIQKIAV